VDVSPVLLARPGHIENLAIVDTYDSVEIAANLLQAPPLLPAVVPGPLNDVRPVLVSATLNGNRHTTVLAEYRYFTVAEVYHIPVLIWLIGKAPLLDNCAILRALASHVQTFIAIPIHDGAGVAHATIWPGASTVDATTRIVIVIATASIVVGSGLAPSVIVITAIARPCVSQVVPDVRHIGPSAIAVTITDQGLVRKLSPSASVIVRTAVICKATCAAHMHDSVRTHFGLSIAVKAYSLIVAAFPIVNPLPDSLLRLSNRPRP